LLQFSNNSIQENRGSFPLVTIELVRKKLDFTGNLFVNNTELEDYNGSNDDNSHAVIQLAGVLYTSQVFVSRNHFSNPDATYELTVNFKPTFTSTAFIIDLSHNFWDRSNYSAVVQRYVLLFSIIYLEFVFLILYWSHTSINHFTYLALHIQRRYALQCESKQIPLRFFDIFSQTVGNFSSIFYTPIIRFHLR